MLRNARHGKILEIISQQEVETQEELCALLNECNFPVTQATISRDIKELRLFKVAGINRRFRYTCISEHEGDISDKMKQLFRACVLDIIPVGNLIVVKTLNGNGSNAGVVIDRLNYREVVGTVAGDDTTLLICSTPQEASGVKEKLIRILQE